VLTGRKVEKTVQLRPIALELSQADASAAAFHDILADPQPQGRCPRLYFVVTKGSKGRLRTSAGIPVPLSPGAEPCLRRD
jgi:hypothetical protein